MVSSNANSLWRELPSVGEFTESPLMSDLDLSVVVLAWNNLGLTRRFVDSVRLYTTVPYELILVDNGSVPEAAAIGRELADRFIRNETNRGFSVGMNQGLAVARGNTVAFCNNDTEVAPGWDAHLVSCAARPGAGLVVPALTAATNLRTVRVEPGTEVEVIAPFSPPPAGAFVLMRADVARALGGWGEEYPIASAEDVDLAFKVWVNDLDLLYDSRVLIRHVNKATSRNLHDWQDLWKRNRWVFLEKWTSSPDVPRVAECAPERFAKNLAIAASAAGWMSQYFRASEGSGATTRPESGVACAPMPVSTPTSIAPHDHAGRPEAEGSVVARLRSLWTSHSPRLASPALRIRYVLPSLQIAGGVLGVLQLVNELRLLGADASVVALGDRKEVYQWRLLHPPTVYRDEAELRRAFPDTDVLVATHYATAPLVHDLVKAGRARVSAYFLQDYEVWFHPEDDQAARERVRATYGLIPHKIVKSDWLARLLERDGYSTIKIPIGLDHGFFYPRPIPKLEPPVVFAMARPCTPRRGFETLTRALELVHQGCPDAQFVLFGQDLKSQPLPFPYRCDGVITDQERIARRYSSATVHADLSHFQAFGRPALESMACGTASVLTDVGGVSSYARNEENCLLVPPREPERAAAAILRLLRDVELRNRIVEEGLRTVRDYSMRREARDTMALFRSLLSHANGPTADGAQ